MVRSEPEDLPGAVAAGGLFAPAAPSAEQGEAPCGHPQSLTLKSAETGEPLYCEACDDKSGRRDAEQMEQALSAKLREADETIRHLNAALRDATEAQTFDPEGTQPAAPVGWQPIETAPNKTEVLIGAWIDGEFKWGRSERFYDSGNEMEGEPACGWVWSIDDCSDSVAEDPSHWMPLPAAPKTGGANG
jgi:hypothetical protein